MGNFHDLVWLGLVILIHFGSTIRADDDIDLEERELSRAKRGAWSMLRLGRGLQMLRLGKRQLPMIRLGRQTDDAAKDLQDYIEEMLKGKALSSRQVPMPRYGKDLGWQTAYENSLNDDEEISRRSEIDGSNNNGYPHTKPFPRGGKVRFRRSLSPRLHQFSNLGFSGSYDTPFGQMERAVALPRIGRLSKERAVPAPRIG